MKNYLLSILAIPHLEFSVFPFSSFSSNKQLENETLGPRSPLRNSLDLRY